MFVLSLSERAEKINYLLKNNRLIYDDLDLLPIGKNKILKFRLDKNKNLYVSINNNKNKLYKISKDVNKNLILSVYKKIVDYQYPKNYKKFFPKIYTYSNHLDLLNQISNELDNFSLKKMFI